MIEPAAAGNVTKINTAVVSMDGSGTPSVTTTNGTTPTTATLTADATPCSFTSSDGGKVIVSSPSGVVLISNQKSDTNYYETIAFPDQAASLSDLNGTWNRIAWQRANTGGLSQPYTLSYGSATLTSGVVSNVQQCPVTANVSGGCTSQSITPGSGLVVNPAGGFSGTGDLSGSSGYTYKFGSNIFAVLVDPDGSLNILTPQTTLAFPTVGATSTSWNIQPTTSGALLVQSGDVSPSLSTSVVTITSVDTTNNIVTRDQTTNGGATVSQTLHYNIPLTGFRKRDGATGVSAIVQLPLPGMGGVTVGSRLGATTPTTPGTGNGFFVFSITQP